MRRLPAELIESELFGYEKVSFTGAAQRRIGKLSSPIRELFLDEIRELTLDMQAKLLGAIQERKIIRIGGNEIIL